MTLTPAATDISGAREVRTTCPYCGVGCGVLARVTADGAVTVRGDPDHPANSGRLCSKGSALGETTGLEERLLYPQIDGRRATWDAALDRVAAAFSATIAQHGQDSVAIYASGQLLTEDYYVANKLMKGFLGSANIDTNSRLCMASSVTGHIRAFGSDTVPGIYEDLELADLVVLVGTNLAWCHPVLYQRLAAAKLRRPQMKIVLVDPRRTMTADIADLHLPIAPDGDVALFSGLLAHLADTGALDREYIDRHTTGFDAALAATRFDPATTAEQTGIAAADLAEFYRLFAGTAKTVTVYSQGVNQSSSGSDKVNAIINCHLATGRIGKPGAGPFSVTGQPNAMGGREVGGLATMLAAHMDLASPQDRDRVKRFWRAPAIAARPGLKAVDLFRAVADGRIRALWIIATNPVDSMPDADAVAAALKACPFVVVSDASAHTDTIAHAHVRLPAAAWGEKDGTVTNSERRISRQRPFLPAPGEARPDWAVIADVARRMGYGPQFAYTGPAEIFAEHAALSGLDNDGTRDFDIGALAGIDREGYDALEPVQWPMPRDTDPPPRRFFADGGFFTPDRKARFVATPLPATGRTSEAFPLALNTGRVRDHWHTMTRTGLSPRLSQHTGEPFAELNPDDARRLGIADADLVWLTSAHGRVLMRALLSLRQRTGSVFVPMHWSGQFSGAARIGALVAPLTDPLSGQPAFKHVPVAAKRFAAALYGFAVLRERPETIDADYWALARCPGGWRLELAFARRPDDIATLAEGLMGAADDTAISYHDMSAGQHRFARFAGERLMAALFLAREPVAIPRNWAVDQLGAAFAAGGPARLALLAARAAAGAPDRGATVCSCFGVGARQIADAAAAGGTTVEEIGAALQAGTNCGSCRSEIRALIARHGSQDALPARRAKR